MCTFGLPLNGERPLFQDLRKEEKPPETGEKRRL